MPAPIRATGGVTPVASDYQISLGAFSLWPDCSCPRIPHNAGSMYGSVIPVMWVRRYTRTTGIATS
jgi:hypothetical protein